MASRSSKRSQKKRGPVRRLLGGLLGFAATLAATFFGFCAFALLLYNLVFPPTTGVQIQRRVEAWIERADYDKRYDPVSAEAISQHLPHAIVAAEDGRFYEHGGIDWEAIEEALEENRNGRRRRGGSTISQQLVKNLFLTTHSNYVRKGLELPLTYLAELLLSKDRILELYMNVVEFGPGVYGAEAAARHHFDRSAEQLSRYQAASLAAILPNPRARSPQRMGSYTNTILTRMRQMGW